MRSLAQRSAWALPPTSKLNHFAGHEASHLPGPPQRPVQCSPTPHTMQTPRYSCRLCSSESPHCRTTLQNHAVQNHAALSPPLQNKMS